MVYYSAGIFVTFLNLKYVFFAGQQFHPRWHKRTVHHPKTVHQSQTLKQHVYVVSHSWRYHVELGRAQRTCSWFSSAQSPFDVEDQRADVIECFGSRRWLLLLFFIFFWYRKWILRCPSFGRRRGLGEDPWISMVARQNFNDYELQLPGASGPRGVVRIFDVESHAVRSAKSLLG